MHASTGRGSGPESTTTQAQADSCCAASDSDGSTPSAPMFSVSLSSALAASSIPGIAPLTAPPLRLGSGHDDVPLPGSHASTHLLLSVFLI
jgi:hypothetical protein